MTKINLIPEVKQREQKIQRVNALTTSISIMIAIALVCVVGGIFAWNQIKSQRISSTNKKIENIKDELKPFQELEENVLMLEKGLKEIKNIIDGDKKWSIFFIELEKVTPADIQIIKFEKTGDDISMDLMTKNVIGVDRFIRSFSGYKYNEENLFQEVKVNGYTRDEGTKTINFKATMKLNSGILWQ